jgi:hypothetical protein
MSMRLFNIMADIQGWFSAYRHNRVIMVKSGYRTEATNDRTENGARNSRHLLGEAGDIWRPDVPAHYLAKLGQYFQGSAGIHTMASFMSTAAPSGRGAADPQAGHQPISPSARPSHVPGAAEVGPPLSRLGTCRIRSTAPPSATSSRRSTRPVCFRSGEPTQ